MEWNYLAEMVKKSAELEHNYYDTASEAGIHPYFSTLWIPACAGMTFRFLYVLRSAVPPLFYGRLYEEETISGMNGGERLSPA